MKRLSLVVVSTVIVFIVVAVGILLLRPKSAPPVGLVVNTHEEPKPALPVELTFRKALTGTGAVAQFHNNTRKMFPVHVVISRPDVGSKAFDLTLDPLMAKEIGYAEGWAVASGDYVEISSYGYKPSRTKFE